MWPQYASGWEVAFCALAIVAFLGKAWVLRQAIKDLAIVRRTVSRKLSYRHSRGPVDSSQIRLDDAEDRVGYANLCLAEGNVEAEIIRLTIPAWFMLVGFGSFYLPPSRLDNLTPGLEALRALMRLSFFFPVLAAAYGSWRSYCRRRQVDRFDECP